MASDRSGRREVNQGQESMVITKRPPSSGNRFLRHSNSSSLEILEPEDSLKIGSNHGKNFHKENRPSSTGKKNSGSVPPRPDSTLTRRTPTPTKQISLQAVRRKEDNDDPIVADIDWKELQSHSRNKGRKDVPTTQLQEMSLSENPRKSDKSSIPFSYSSNHHNCSHHHVEKPERREEERVKGASKPTKESQKKDTRKTSPEHVAPETVTTKPEEEEEEDSSSSDEEEEEERKAPNQLLMEFVTSLMEKDYVSAEKLCKMILLYEPDNPEALKFQPLIEEKIALDNEPEYESGESEGEEGYDDKDDEDNDDDDEDDDGTEDDDSDSSDSDTDSDSDEDDSEQEEQRVDSGIASAAGSEFNV